MNHKVVEMAMVRAIRSVAQGIFQVDLRCPQVADLVLPGQFVTVEPGIASATCRRPFTVYSRTDEGIRLVFQDVGPNTHAYSQWQAGQKVEILGPCGQGISIDTARKCFLMLAGGCGLASMHLPTWEIGEQTSARIIVGCGFRRRAQVFGQADFQKIITDPNDLHVVTQEEDNKTAVDLLRVILNSESELPPPDKIQIITCGRNQMMQQVAAIAKQAGISCLVFIEQVMGCGGLGACCSCAVPLKAGGFAKLCEDGPVFLAEEVNWDELV